MEMLTFVRKPFTVDAIQITKENIAELAELVGKLLEDEEGNPYIQVDKKKVPNVFRVVPGYWVTKMGNNIRCYTEKIFAEQFTANTPDIQSWVDFLNKESIPEVAKEPV